MHSRSIFDLLVARIEVMQRQLKRLSLAVFAMAIGLLTLSIGLLTERLWS